MVSTDDAVSAFRHFRAHKVRVGLVSALGPAIKASFIRPAEALRYE